MISDALTRKILARVQALEDWVPRFRSGEVTVASPLTIKLGGGATTISSVQALRSYAPVVGDIVSCLQFAGDLLVLGAIGAPEAWHVVGAGGEPAFQNSWVNMGGSFPTAAFYKDAAGIVHLRGGVTAGAASTIFTLPAGYRPAFSEDYAQSQNGVFAQMRVTAAGDVLQAVGAARTNQFISWSFRAEG